MSQTQQFSPSCTTGLYWVTKSLSIGDDKGLISSNIPAPQPEPDGMREDSINCTTHLETAAAGLGK